MAYSSFSSDMDDEYEKRITRMNPPRVVIDNESCTNATIIQVGSANEHVTLLEVVQLLNDLNLLITKAYISSDGGWFMDVLHVTDLDGNKITDEGVLNHIHKSLGPDRRLADSRRSSFEALVTRVSERIASYAARREYYQCPKAKDHTDAYLEDGEESNSRHKVQDHGYMNLGNAIWKGKSVCIPEIESPTPAVPINIFDRGDFMFSRKNGVLESDVHIDIPEEKYSSTDQITQQQWKKYVVRLKGKLESDYSVMGQSILVITGQAAAAILSRAFTDSSYPSWAEHFVEAATVAGFVLTASGIGVGRLKPKLSSAMIKIGAMATAFGIIVSLGLPQLPTAVAWTVGPVASLLVAIGVAFA